MSATEHDRFHEDVGAYLLGALGDGEREAFERHLSTCHVCQDEIDRLGTAADVLPRAVEQFEPPASLKRELMKQVYAEAEPERAPRRSLLERLGLAGGLAGLTPQAAAVATAFVLAVGLLSGYAISKVGGTSDNARTIAAAVDANRAGAARATLVVPEDGGAGQLRVTSMPQPPPGKVYEIWLKRGNQIEPGPLFSVDRQGNGVGAVPGDLDGVGAVLVTREKRVGATAPSEAPVVTAKL